MKIKLSEHGRMLAAIESTTTTLLNDAYAQKHRIDRRIDELDEQREHVIQCIKQYQRILGNIK